MKMVSGAVFLSRNLLFYLTHLSCWRSCLRRPIHGSARVLRVRGCCDHAHRDRALHENVRDLHGCARCGNGRGASGRGRAMSSFCHRGSERD